jgi:hypothetical protein
MKKLFLAVTLLVAAFAASAGTFDIAVKGTMSGSTSVIPYKDARYLDLTPGAMSLTTMAGSANIISIAAADVTAMLNSPTFQANWVNYSGNKWFNASGATQIICSNGQTIVGWALGASDFLPDNCALFNAVYAQAK